MTTILRPFLIVLLALGAFSASTVAEAEKMAPPYVSPDRARCEEELGKDKAWHADLELQLYDNVHETESATFTRNNKHVVMAYGALWVLTAGFLVFMWMRQGKLKLEIARLSGEVAKASKDQP